MKSPLFETQRNLIKSKITEVDKIIRINNKLSNYRWAFIFPNLFGFELSQLEGRANAPNTTELDIFHLFAVRFYDLKLTSSLIEGHFKERKSMKPFCPLIEQSVIMALQRDYAGAINTLIPVIEGTIRHYLVDFHGKDNSKMMKSGELIRSFFCNVIQEYRSKIKDHLDKINEKNVNSPLDKNQKKTLLKLEMEWVSKWISIIGEYLKKNLFLDTRDGNVIDILNRHNIVHGFSVDLYYNLPNYLRLFHSIQFLSWALGLAEPGVKAIPDIKYEDFAPKWKLLEKLVLIDSISKTIKSEIQANIAGFDKASFEYSYSFGPVQKLIEADAGLCLEKKLKKVDAYFALMQRIRDQL